MKWELIIIVTLVFLVALPMGMAKKGDITRGSYWDRVEVENGKFNQVIYSNDVNLKNGSGVYKPISDVVTLKSQNDAITISWNGKIINMSSYIKVPPGQQKKADKQGLGMTSNKAVEKGKLSWEHRFTNISVGHKFGYDITYDGVSCSQQGNRYYCDELIIDFGKWAEKNLTLAMGLNNIEVSGNDLSDLDPTVIVNGTNQIEDTYIWSGQPNWNEGGDTTFPSVTSQRGMLNANVTSISSGSIITYAMLYLYTDTGNGGITKVYMINHSWNEGNSLGATNDASINGTTWNERWYGNNANDGNSPFDATDPDWEVAGLGAEQDYNSSFLDNHSTVSASYNLFNITLAVREWTSGSKQNYGVLIFGTTGPTFYSSENTDTTKTPYLNVTYTVSPQINSNNTIPSIPLWGQNLTIRVNITNSSVGNSMQWVNFTLVAPNGTSVIDRINGTQFDSFWNSTKVMLWGLEADGTWNWSVNGTDWSGLSTKYNSSFDINDSAPVISTVVFNATVTIGKDLAIVPTALDAESNNISYFYQWFANRSVIISNNSNLSGGDIYAGLNLTGSVKASDIYKNSSWSNTSTAAIGDTNIPHFATHNLSNSTQYSDTPISFNISVWDDSSEISQCWAEIIHPGDNVSNNSMSFTLGQNIIPHLIFSNYTAHNTSIATYNVSRVSCWDAVNNYNSTYVNHPFNITERQVTVSNMTLNPTSYTTGSSTNVSVLCTKDGSVTIASAYYTVVNPDSVASNNSLSGGADNFWSATYSGTGTGTHRFTHWSCTDSNGNIGLNTTSLNLTVSAAAVDTGRGGGGGGGAADTTNISQLLESVVSGQVKCGNNVCESGETRENCYQDCRISLTNLTPFLKAVIWGVAILFGYIVIKTQTSKRRKSTYAQ